MAPYIRFRLAKALGMAPDDRGDPADFLSRREGRLFVTSSHVDLVMPLERASLPIRMAGLDRDPGWLADFGRVIQFHFR